MSKASEKRKEFQQFKFDEHFDTTGLSTAAAKSFKDSVERRAAYLNQEWMRPVRDKLLSEYITESQETLRNMKQGFKSAVVITSVALGLFGGVLGGIVGAVTGALLGSADATIRKSSKDSHMVKEEKSSVGAAVREVGIADTTIRKSSKDSHMLKEGKGSVAPRSLPNTLAKKPSKKRYRTQDKGLDMPPQSDAIRTLLGEKQKEVWTFAAREASRQKKKKSELHI